MQTGVLGAKIKIGFAGFLQLSNWRRFLLHVFMYKTRQLRSAFRCLHTFARYVQLFWCLVASKSRVVSLSICSQCWLNMNYFLPDVFVERQME